MACDVCGTTTREIFELRSECKAPGISHVCNGCEREGLHRRFRFTDLGLISDMFLQMRAEYQGEERQGLFRRVRLALGMPQRADLRRALVKVMSERDAALAAMKKEAGTPCP